MESKSQAQPQQQIQSKTQSQATFFQAFKTHPESVGETYFEHMFFAGAFAIKLLLAGCAALIHSIIPPLFEHTASKQISALHKRIEDRKNAAAKENVSL